MTTGHPLQSADEFLRDYEDIIPLGKLVDEWEYTLNSLSKFITEFQNVICSLKFLHFQWKNAYFKRSKTV